MPGLLYADDFLLGGRSEATVGCFIEVCRRRGLKVNAGKSKVILLGGVEELDFEVCVNGIR